MIREFVHLQHFEKSWKALGLSDEELRALENIILGKPDIGELIQGTGGLRKTRASIDNRGKSSGIRVLYTDFEFYKKTYFLFAYPKNELETITDKQKKMFRNMINELLNELKIKKDVKQ